MIQDITRQPQEGVIGGMRDLTAQITQASRAFVESNATDVAEGFTSPAQGRDYDAAIVCNQETLTADHEGKNLQKAIPWAALIVLGFIAYIVTRE